jgi:hypothetical protein
MDLINRSTRIGTSLKTVVFALFVPVLLTACGGLEDTQDASAASAPTEASVSYGLTVSKTGSGTVSSSPSGINCGTTCSATYASGTSVTLTASPASGYSFSGWSGACSGTGACTVSMSQARSVTANFSQTIASNTATLAWDPPASSTNLSGYRIYYGTAPGTYQQALGQGISVGNVTAYTLLGLSYGIRYYFVVTAFTTNGTESVYSNEVFKDIP